MRLGAIAAVAAMAIPVTAAVASGTPATGSLYFARPTAKLVGGTALVPVECVGVQGAVCSGELSLRSGGSTSEAPFSVAGGGRRIVSIPAPGGSGASVVATAETAQSSGAYAGATEVLRLR